MPKNWRFHSILTLIALLLSIYYLIPTWGGFGQVREQSEKDQKPLPWHLNLFPREEIKLGLDLQGGIYVEMEVELADALKNRSDLFASEVERLTKTEAFAPEKVERIPDTTQFKITLKKEDDRSNFSKWLDEHYKGVLLEKRAERADKVAVLDLTEEFSSRTKEQSAKQAVETIRNRIDRYGVSEPTIVRLGTNRISIELPGMTDPERALNLIKKGGRLEFRLVDDSKPDDEVRKLVSEARTALNTPEGFTEEIITKINTQLKDKIPAESEILFEVQYDPVTKKVSGGLPYLIKRKSEVTGDMLKNAQVNVHDNEPYVSLSFNALGTKLFGEVTKANVGKRLAILLDGNVMKAPVIKSEIPSGEAQITLGYGDYQTVLKEAEDLTLVLHEGALPARMKELTKTVVGPSLGKDSVDKGLKVSLWAAVLVALFMALYYRISGILADVALLLNVLIMMACLAMFQATLTLPGIAGIVLTIGMAVDANVLIFERIREELRAGKSAKAALAEGYSNAKTAIVDSNITTFLAGVVLYQFGTGAIRGFAVTLMVGIMTTLFTTIWVTRILQEGLLYGLKRERISV
ncbi:MAG: protein translocase subunit SecD [Deltaproteobacteria bacterium]|nr:MAG: protein translocase subunit SecD [Deltaproteobacteria bacterium]